VNVKAPTATMERIEEKLSRIAARLKIVPDCDWYGRWHDGMVERLARRDIDGMDVVLWALVGFSHLAGNVVVLNRQVVQLEAAQELDGVQIHRPSLAVNIPSRGVQVTNPTQKTILYVMGKAGLGRRWRVAERVRELANVSKGTIRNAFGTLVQDGLVAPYQHQGRLVRYRYGRGCRTLYVLTEDGRLWYQENYGEAAESELDRMISRHGGVQHAVDILEVRDLMQGLGLKVNDAPAPLLATGDEWGPRSEPDLVVQYAGHDWPVEVQREVRSRNDSKWEKVLELSEGWLMLILESDAKQRSQARILRDAALHLPPGEILLSNLEHLRGVDQLVNWEEIVTGG
jgi:hypothetical protein